MLYYYQLIRFHIANQLHLTNKRLLNKNMNRLLIERRKLRNFINLKSS